MLSIVFALHFLNQFVFLQSQDVFARGRCDLRYMSNQIRHKRVRRKFHIKFVKTTAVSARTSGTERHASLTFFLFCARCQENTEDGNERWLLNSVQSILQT